MRLYKLLRIVFYYIAPLVIAFLLFVQGESVKTQWSFVGLIGLVLLFLTYYKGFKDYEKTQRQAHETAKNLGQVSKSVNFILLAVVRFGFTITPFLIVLLVDAILRSYSGNATIGISFLLISFAVAEFFGVLAHTAEQKTIQERLHAQTQADNERLAQVIKEQL
jgi:phosphoglycerol transferase MdoB-like AlkP superfamily enzyme